MYQTSHLGDANPADVSANEVSWHATEILKEQKMDLHELEQGTATLASLSVEEYGMNLEMLLGQQNEDARFQRLSRLIGIVLKEPFAEPIYLDNPSPEIGALRAWNLIDARLSESSKLNTWQYKTLDKLRTNGDLTQELGWIPSTTYELAVKAQHERGFFGYLAISIRKYLCRDSKLRAEIEANVEEARRSGFDVKTMAPDVIVSSAGLALGSLLVQSVPILSTVGAPVIAGLVLIIYNIGLDAFCSWTTSREGEIGKTEH
jgi:hypothetical protein